MHENPERPWAASALLWLLGAWFALTAGVGHMASGNFRAVEPSSLRDSDTVFAKLDEGEERRKAIRYIASELNRRYFTEYGYVNIGLAAAALGLLLLSRRRSRTLLAILATCTAFALVIGLYLTPEITALGRRIDFDRPDDVVARFGMLHGIDVLLEMAKLALLVWATVLLLRAARPVPSDA